MMMIGALQSMKKPASQGKTDIRHMPKEAAGLLCETGGFALPQMGIALFLVSSTELSRPSWAAWRALKNFSATCGNRA